MLSDHPPVFHLTFSKCGSQWVRDVISAPEILEHSGFVWSPGNFAEGWREWSSIPNGTLVGPCYRCSKNDWEANRQAGQKAIVVIRDPRDRMISWLHSMNFSHRASVNTSLLRDLMDSLETRHWCQLGLFEFVLTAKLYVSWAEQPAEGALVITYEELVSDEFAGFQQIFDFLGWEIPEETLRSTVSRLSFSTRSGRERGVEEVHSHYRKGEPGDWRRFFDREMGALWEHSVGGALSALGYEADDKWFVRLPETLQSLPRIQATEPLHELKAENVRLREENEELRRAVEAFRSALENHIE